MGDRIVVIGGSWGGFDAATEVLRDLPSLDVPVVLVLHRAASTDDVLERALAQRSSKPVCEADDKMPLDPGCVYLAPPDYHLLVEDGHLGLSIDAPELYARPSIDVLFESAADAYGPGTVAVVLTGANADGAKGAQRVRHRGGTVIVQDPATAVRPEMPAAAVDVATHVVPLEEIAPLVARLCGGAERD